MLKALMKHVGKAQVVIAIALLTGTVMGLMDYFGLNATYEAKTLDLRFALRETREPSASDPIVLVLIDDQSMDALKLRWPWPRSIYAKALRNLARAGAKVVAFDLIFSEPSQSSRQDDALAAALAESSSRVVLGGKFYMKKTQLGEETSFVAPIRGIDAARENVGYVNYWADEDGILRYGTIVRTHQGKFYESFVMKILSGFYGARLAKEGERLRLGPLAIELDDAARVLINYRGGPGSFRSISFENILDEEIFKGLEENGTFRDKIVLIGPTFTEAQDNHFTPFFMESGPTAGVEVHADFLDTIMSGQYIRKIPPYLRLFLVILLPLSLALVTVHLKPWKGLLVLAATAVLYIAVAIWLFLSFRLVAPIFNPTLALFLSHLMILGYLLVTEELQSRHIKGLFSRYVSPKVVDQLVRNPHAELRLGGNKQTITVLFSDIRGFTTLSEQLAPEQVVELLNEYFQTMTEVIFRHDGMVDKFIGDAIMAIFGAPVAHPDDPIRAVRAALDMKAALARLKEKWAGEGKRVFDIGVGINTGEAIVGNMGSQQAMGYTAIGDTVNLASRLESANKDVGSSGILISESTYQAVAGLVEAREHAGIKVKGKANALSVFEVLGLK